MDTPSTHWANPFSTPTIGCLLDALPVEAKNEMEQARKRLGRASVRWHGLPWRWTVQLDRQAGPAALIPDPQSPRIALALPVGFFEDHPPEHLDRRHRDLLVRAVVVADTVWSEWSLASVGACETVLGLVGE